MQNHRSRVTILRPPKMQKKTKNFKIKTYIVTNILIWYDRWSHALFYKLLVLGIHDYKWAVQSR